MTKKLRFIAIVACLSLSFSSFAEELIFINDDLRTGLNRAASEGKLVFLEFWASYCTPCKMMEEYTFTNSSVIERMSKSYVPVKVNIQSFDGFDLKNQYKVTVLPTIIILDSKGRQVARYEETMAPTKLNAVLDKHNLPQYRNRVAPVSYNTNAGFNPTNKPNNTLSATPNTTSNPPKVALSATVHPQTNNQPQKVNAPTTAATTNVPSEVGTRRAIPTSGFTIQVGAYGQLKSAQGAVEEMKAKTGGQKQYIMQSKTDGKTTYRILIGNFTSRQQADAFRKKSAIEGYVRGFDEFNKKN